MSTPYDHGQRNAGNTTNAPDTQTLLNRGYTWDQARQFQNGHRDAKK
jgi:hypothetical protein